MDFVWDAGSDFEVEGCKEFPWSQNGVQEEDFAPVDWARCEHNPDERDGLDDMNDPNQDRCEDAGNGEPGACPISKTIDEKAPEDGLAPEAVTLAVACDRLLAISCGESNGYCFLYDITEISSGQDPILRTVFNLSPTSENKSPGVAYDDRTLGDLDAEVTLFVTGPESPTGKAGIVFGGAHSGTLSFWEFECTEPVEAVDRVFVGLNEVSETNDDEDDDDGLTSGAKAGIVIAALAFAAACAFLYRKFLYEPRKALRQKQNMEISDAETPDNGNSLS